MYTFILSFSDETENGLGLCYETIEIIGSKVFYQSLEGYKVEISPAQAIDIVEQTDVESFYAENKETFLNILRGLALLKTA